MFGQRTIDTSELYNGELKHKQILISKAGQIEKETYFYGDGKIEIEYFLKNNEKVHWISYDKNGIKSAEWIDPDIEYAPQRGLKNIVFILTALSLSLLVYLSSKYLTYKTTYFSILFLTILFPLVSLVIERRIDLDNIDPEFALVIASTLVLLPSILFLLSIFTLTKDIDISKALSVISIVICLFLFLFFAMVYNISGASM